MTKKQEAYKMLKRADEIDRRLNDLKILSSNWSAVPLIRCKVKVPGHRLLELELKPEILKKVRDLVLKDYEKEVIALEEEYEEIRKTY